MSTEKFLLHDNQIFKQSYYNELNFFGVKNSSLYFEIKRLSELEAHGTLYKDNNQNVIEENVSLNIVDDVRDLISISNVDDWIIKVRQTDKIQHIRDIYLYEGFDDGDGYSEPAYFAINLSDTPLGNKFEESYRVDIYDINDYVLYHKEDNTYYLICDTRKI